MAPRIRIAMLNADTPVANVLPTWATYGNMFHNLLVAAASRIAPHLEVQSTNYNTQQLQYPELLVNFDVILVTGSASSVYDDEDWIRRLGQFILHVYNHHPHIKIFGSCFGHQLICQSLLKEYHVRVEKDPNGWELGVRDIQLNKNFRDTVGVGARSFLKSGAAEIPKNLRVQFFHADHVLILIPEALPRSWMAVGSTSHCAVQGVYEPGRVFTLQGHFEFDRFVSTELVKVFGATWKSEMVKETLDAIDAEVAAEVILQFMLEREGSAGGGILQTVLGLSTPPHIE
jgi:GMP synthase-like glutamine amidotransferase